MTGLEPMTLMDFVYTVYYGTLWIGGMITVMTFIMIPLDKDFDGKEFGFYSYYLTKMVRKCLGKL